LGDADVVTLFGGSSIDYRAFSGGRLTAGTWLDAYRIFGFEAVGFLLESRSRVARFSSNARGFPPLGIPFINADTGQEDFADFATPDETVGKLDISSSSHFGGAETNLVFNLLSYPSCTLEVLGGFRYLGLRENLKINGSTSPLAGEEVFFGGDVFDPPAVTSISDQIRTSNDFFGGQLGCRTRLQWGEAFVDVAGKLALGDSHEVTRIDGTSSLLAGPVGPVRTLPGGLFALPSNIGRRSKDEFAVVPELEVRLGYQVRSVNAFIGYNFLSWSRVARPGQQIDRTLNPSQIPTFREFVAGTQQGPPIPLANSTDFAVHGLSFGLEFKF
jgi:hypothetical protein